MSTSPARSEGHEHLELTLKEVPIHLVKPYWRNPRRISDEAVNAVAASIQQFGYTQPISVDKDNVIIAGHTRYQAMRRLGATEVVVIVRDDLTQEQVKQLRTIDNKTAEYTRWDFEKLTAEVEGLDALVIGQFFPEFAAEDVASVEIDLSGDDDERAADAVSPKFEPSRTAEFLCPHCFHSWQQNVNPSEVQSGVITGKG